MEKFKVDPILTRANFALYPTATLVEKWRDLPRRHLEEIRRVNGGFPNGAAAVRILMDEIDAREHGDFRADIRATAGSLERRVEKIENQMPPPPKPERKTWALWVAIASLLVGAGSLVVAVVALRRTAAQEIRPTPPTPQDSGPPLRTSQ